MKFNMPVKQELTLLDELCIKYGVTLDHVESYVLEKLPANEIMIVLQYELTKRRRIANNEIQHLRDRRAKADWLLGKGKTSDAETMKLHADIEHYEYQIEKLTEYVKYLFTLGV